MRRALVVGGSIAGVTIASTLHDAGWDGQITLVSDETCRPYSRVPLSKGILTGTQSADTATLADLPDAVELVLGRRAVSLDISNCRVLFDDGTSLEYDALAIATGSRARRLAAPGQDGELVLRTLADAEMIAERLPDARSAVVVGGGFLGMEIASTLRSKNLDVTVIDRDPPLQRLLGDYLAELVVGVAADAGVKVVHAPGDVELVGNPIRAVRYGDGQQVEADLVISAVGDLPNVEWLKASGLPLAGGLIADDRCLVAPGIVAAGDVVARQMSGGPCRRTPHWTNAVVQAKAAALTLIDAECDAYRPDHYFWTELFGLDLKIAGELPLVGQPEVLAGDPAELSALFQWQSGGTAVAAAALNHRMPIVRLKALASARPTT